MRTEIERPNSNTESGEPIRDIARSRNVHNSTISRLSV